MSGLRDEEVKRDYSFTVRLSAEERAMLEALAERFRLDKSATLRRSLRFAVNRTNAALPESGHFVAVNAAGAVIPVRLSRKGSCHGKVAASS